MGGFAPGGVSSGHSPGSAHYEGRAVDVFVRPVTVPNRQHGWAVAQYLVANAGAARGRYRDLRRPDLDRAPLVPGVARLRTGHTGPFARGRRDPRAPRPRARRRVLSGRRLRVEWSRAAHRPRDHVRRRAGDPIAQGQDRRRRREPAAGRRRRGVRGRHVPVRLADPETHRCRLAVVDRPARSGGGAVADGPGGRRGLRDAGGGGRGGFAGRTTATARRAVRRRDGRRAGAAARTGHRGGTHRCPRRRAGRRDRDRVRGPVAGRTPRGDAGRLGAVHRPDRGRGRRRRAGRDRPRGGPPGAADAGRQRSRPRGSARDHRAAVHRRRQARRHPDPGASHRRPGHGVVAQPRRADDAVPRAGRPRAVAAGRFARARRRGAPGRRGGSAAGLPGDRVPVDDAIRVGAGADAVLLRRAAPRRPRPPRRPRGRAAGGAGRPGARAPPGAEERRGHGRARRPSSSPASSTTATRVSWSSRSTAPGRPAAAAPAG